LKDRRHRLFLEQGGSAEQEIRETNARLRELREEARKSFPLQADEAARFRAGLAERILRIHDKEKEAIETLRSIMSQ
jgi:hypothetical protein